MIHRVGIDKKNGIVLGHTGPEISDAFTGRNPDWPDVAKATNGQNAYTFLIGGDQGDPIHDGRIWQCLTIDEIGWHARSASREFVGIGCIGDFRADSPPSKQWKAAALLASVILEAIGSDHLSGHGEIATAHGGEKAPGQPYACPGDLWSMSDFRKDVGELRSALRWERFVGSGIVVSS